MLVVVVVVVDDVVVVVVVVAVAAAAAAAVVVVVVAVVAVVVVVVVTSFKPSFIKFKFSFCLPSFTASFQLAFLFLQLALFLHCSRPIYNV